MSFTFTSFFFLFSSNLYSFGPLMLCFEFSNQFLTQLIYLKNVEIQDADFVRCKTSLPRTLNVKHEQKHFLFGTLILRPFQLCLIFLNIFGYFMNQFRRIGKWGGGWGGGHHLVHLFNQSINQSTLFKHGKWLSKLVFRHAV